MRHGSESKPFYLYLRKSSGVYYAEIKDPVSGALLPAKSTGERTYRDAERVAWEWTINGLPVGPSGESRKKPGEAASFELAFQQLNDVPIGQAEAQRILDLLKRRG